MNMKIDKATLGTKKGKLIGGLVIIVIIVIVIIVAVVMSASAGTKAAKGSYSKDEQSKITAALLVSLKTGNGDADSPKRLWEGKFVPGSTTVTPENIACPVTSQSGYNAAKWDWKDNKKVPTIGSFLSWNPDSVNSKGEHGELDIYFNFYFRHGSTYKYIFGSLYASNLSPKIPMPRRPITPKTANDETFFYDSAKLVSIINNYLISAKKLYGLVWEG